FMGCSQLKKIIIPASVQKIEEDAFRCCENLREIAINDRTLCMDESILANAQILHLSKNQNHLEILLDSENPDFSEQHERKLLFRFWMQKDEFTRRLYFKQIRKPAYKIPLAVLMTDAQDSVYKNYIRENYQEVQQYLYARADEENGARIMTLCR
ncbi:MAG: leucine-rich repeat domain-containing protein, partial [Oscillospiraceae bacterium]|nr:leucine-rich repeat domain-containing protein [Oscillospiraceae bacterium]